jgi:transcription-repair coupling factor (superfamily II helicase)
MIHLRQIATNTDLGAGMRQVALKDLEIRGAGNLLGGEQSGTYRRLALICICGWWLMQLMSLRVATLKRRQRN